jgi:FkbM family methyltransferase
VSVIDDARFALGAFESLLEDALRTRTPERLRSELAAGCWIYGAGKYGQKIGGLLKAQGYRIEGFIDRRAGAGLVELQGAPVVHPDAVTGAMAQGRALVAAVVNSQPAADAVAPWAQARPFGAILKGADLPDVLGAGADTFWLSSRADLARNLQRLRPLVDRLADAASTEAFVGALKFRATGDVRHLQAADEAGQYLPPDLPGFDRPITFVDGGAYDGDSCKALQAAGVVIDRYLAFEPDLANLALLADFLRTSPVREATVLPCGLSDHLHDVTFADGQGVCSHVAGPGAGGVTIRCVALDETLPGLRPDYIKLDIEGSELAALEGMKGIVTDAAPRLAVCLYHKPQDIWEIPEWIVERYSRFYVRQHGGFGFDTVLYALPDR